jgi:hypothetical protein
MSTKLKVILTVVAFTVIGFLIQPPTPIGAQIWPPSADIPAPEGAQVPLLMLYGLVAAIGFGIGIAFLLFGRPLVASLGLAAGMTTAMHLSVFWFLGNWVVHESLHIANGHNMWGLIALEWGFHATMVLAGVIIILGLLQVARMRATPATARPTKA